MRVACPGCGKRAGMRFKADLTLTFVALIWGFSFVLQRNAAQQVTPLALNAARWLLGGLIMLPLVHFRLVLNRKSLPWMLAGGGLLFLASGLQQTGLEFTTASNAGFITGTYVVLIPLILAAVWKEKPAAITWISALISCAGLYLLGTGGSMRLNPGDAIELAGAVLWALHVIVTGKAVKSMPAIQFATGQYLVCALLNILAGLAVEPYAFAQVLPAWQIILYLAVGSTAIGFTLQAYGQQHAPPADAAIILSLETVFAAIFGWWLLSERLAPLQLAGCALILTAILLPQAISALNAKKKPAGAGA